MNKVLLGLLLCFCVVGNLFGATNIYTGFPSLQENDGKFLVLAGPGLQTFVNEPIRLWVGIPAGKTNVEIGIFDGDSGKNTNGVPDWINGHWDRGTNNLIFAIFADPYKSMSTNILISKYYGSNMPNNAWFNFNISSISSAKAPSGNYFYMIVISAPQLGFTDWAAFKIRCNREISLLPGTFGVMGIMATWNDLETLYPSFPALTPRTYDGEFNLIEFVPAPQETLDFWDGDFDYGDSYGISTDTDDLDTSNAIPVWAGTGVLPEGAKGIGEPPDDYNANSYFVATPGTINETNIVYEIKLPNGIVFTNFNPSGNSEWEKFTISTNLLTSADYHTKQLPAGYYDWTVKGMDILNLCFIHAGETLSSTNHLTVGGDGCSPGYWKQSQHFGNWVGYKTTDIFNSIFGVNAPGNLTLLQTLNDNGGGYRALNFQAVAALLNTSNTKIPYEYNSLQVIAMVQNAYRTGDYETTKNLFATQNNKTCPLGCSK